jgi:hypothetical protein
LPNAHQDLKENLMWLSIDQRVVESKIWNYGYVT